MAESQEGGPAAMQTKRLLTFLAVAWVLSLVASVCDYAFALACEPYVAKDINQEGNSSSPGHGIAGIYDTYFFRCH